MYLKIANALPEIKGIKKEFMLKNDKDIDQIKNFVNLYASNFYFEQNKWILFENLVKEIPLDINKIG